MVVVDHEPHDWFLLRDEQGLVLDVNCGQSAVGYSVVVRLTGTETGLVETRGREVVTELARSIQNSPAAFVDRSGGASMEQAAYAAIVLWQATQPAT